MSKKRPLVTPSTEHTTQGLRVVLFDELDRLRKGQTTPQKASALARVAGTIIAATKLDLEYQRFAKDLYTKGGRAVVPPLVLTNV